MTVLNTDTLADTPYQVTVSQNLGMNPTEINHRVNRVRNYDAFDFKHYKYKCKECLVGYFGTTPKKVYFKTYTPNFPLTELLTNSRIISCMSMISWDLVNS